MTALQKLTPAEQSLLALLPEGEAKEEFRANGLPHRRVEQWRWSDLRSVLKAPIALSGDYSGETASRISLETALEFVFANGQLVTQPETLPQVIKVSSVVDRQETVEAALPKMAAALVPVTHVLEVSGEVGAPIFLRYLSDGAGMHQTRLRVQMAKGAKATVIEEYQGGEGSWLSNNLSEFLLAEKASLTRILLQEAAPAATTIITGLLDLAKQATYHQTSLAFGGKLARIETQLTHAGENTHATISGAYLLEGGNHLDNTTLVSHLSTEGETGELHKGVLNDQSKGVFQGKFYIAKGAQQTDAQMSHNALLLSEDAEVNAKPELEIYADDVQCADGNTAGALDDDTLFYMRQRGLSEGEARGLLVEAFVAEVLEQVEDETLRSTLLERVQLFMGRRHEF